MTLTWWLRRQNEFLMVRWPLRRTIVDSSRLFFLSWDYDFVFSDTVTSDLGHKDKDDRRDEAQDIGHLITWSVWTGWQQREFSILTFVANHPETWRSHNSGGWQNILSDKWQADKIKREDFWSSNLTKIIFPPLQTDLLYLSQIGFQLNSLEDFQSCPDKIGNVISSYLHQTWLAGWKEFAPHIRGGFTDFRIPTLSEHGPSLSHDLHWVFADSGRLRLAGGLTETEECKHKHELCPPAPASPSQ